MGLSNQKVFTSQGCRGDDPASFGAGANKDANAAMNRQSLIRRPIGTGCPEEKMPMRKENRIDRGTRFGTSKKKTALLHFRISHNFRRFFKNIEAIRSQIH